MPNNTQWLEHDGQRLVLNPELVKPRPISEWHEDMGDQLWWKFPIEEAPYVGSPLDLGATVEAHVRLISQVDQEHEPQIVRRSFGGWPGYHTHFTPIPLPELPDAATQTPAA